MPMIFLENSDVQFLVRLANELDSGTMDTNRKRDYMNRLVLINDAIRDQINDPISAGDKL